MDLVNLFLEAKQQLVQEGHSRVSHRGRVFSGPAFLGEGGGGEGEGKGEGRRATRQAHASKRGAPQRAQGSRGAPSRRVPGVCGGEGGHVRRARKWKASRRKVQ